MKIIKQGQNPKDQILRGTCKTCKCEVELIREEARFVPGERAGENGSYAVTCPCCDDKFLWVN